MLGRPRGGRKARPEGLFEVRAVHAAGLTPRASLDDRVALRRLHAMQGVIDPSVLPARAVLAPLSGVTDLPFRLAATRFGAPFVVSEMVACAALADGEPEFVRRAAGKGRLSPLVIQLAGREERWMARGAEIAEDTGADIIDINMGCPAKKVTNGLSGSALMRDLDHATRLIEATVRATTRPVTVKMRLGWDEHSLNASTLAARAEAVGARAITVHARTRNQFYEGRADWTKVAPVRAATRLPLIVNGDIVDATSARAALSASGADAVMIGRGAYGRPWLIAEVDAALAGRRPPPPPSRAAVLASLAEQVEDSLVLYGAREGLRTVRKHLAWTVDVLEAAGADADRKALRANLCQLEEPALVFAALAHWADAQRVDAA